MLPAELMALHGRWAALIIVLIAGLGLAFGQCGCHRPGSAPSSAIHSSAIHSAIHSSAIHLAAAHTAVAGKLPPSPRVASANALPSWYPAEMSDEVSGCGPDDNSNDCLNCASAWHSRMLVPRRGHLAVRLRRGDLLVVGGAVGSSEPVSERFDASEKRWVALAGPSGYVDETASGDSTLAQALVPHGGGALFVQVLGGTFTVAEFTVGRGWTKRPAPDVVVTDDWADHLALAALDSGEAMLVAWNTMALFRNGTWRSRPAPEPSGYREWLAALPDGGALMLTSRLSQPPLVHRLLPNKRWQRLRDSQVAAARFDRRRGYAITRTHDGRLVIGGGCSDGGECWGDADLAVYDPQTGRMSATQGVLNAEHSVDPWLLPGGRTESSTHVMITSNFAGGVAVERCAIASLAEKTPDCNYSACSIPERLDFAAIAEDRGCMLVVGGRLGGERTDEVLRLCWP